MTNQHWYDESDGRKRKGAMVKYNHVFIPVVSIVARITAKSIKMALFFWTFHLYFPEHVFFLSLSVSLDVVCTLWSSGTFLC